MDHPPKPALERALVDALILDEGILFNLHKGPVQVLGLNVSHNHVQVGCALLGQVEPLF